MKSTSTNGWSTLLLGEVYDFRSGLSKPRSEFGFGHGFLSFKDIFENYFVPDRLTQLVNSTESERELCSVRRGDVFLTRTSETMDKLGMSCVALKDYDGATFNGFTKRLRPKSPDTIVPEYAGYYFRSPKFRQAVTAMSSMSTRASLNNEMLQRLFIDIPPIAAQKAIGSTLKSLDDKIELNRRMNSTLETMARALFQSWFVDFDPVRAKLDGRQSAGLDSVTAALFPNEFEDSELGPIPKGWRVGKISDACMTQYGYTASATEDPVGPHFLRVMDINKQDWIDWSSVPYCDMPDEDKQRYSLSVGDIVVARMADPGKSAIVERKIDAVFASYLVRLKTESLAHAYYLYYWLKSPAYSDYSAGAMSGSVQKNMNAKVIVAAELLSPSTSLIQAFLERVLPLRQRITANLIESRALAAIRDALLPKLLAGELRVPEPNML